MTNTINDYVFELQWNGNKVTKGIDAIEARLNRLANKAQKISNIQIKSSGGKPSSMAAASRAASFPTSITVGTLNVTAGTAKVAGVGSPTSNIQSTRRVNQQAPYTPYDARGRQKEATLLSTLDTSRVAVLDQVNARMEKMNHFLRTSGQVGGEAGSLISKNTTEALNKWQSFQDKWSQGSVTTRKELNAMRQELYSINKETRQLDRNAREVASKFSIVDNITKRVGATFLAFGASTIGAYALVNTARAAYDATKQYEKLDVALTAAFGSQAASTKEMQYAEGVAKKFALDIFAVGEGWSKIAYAAKMSNMPMDQARQMFEDLAVSSRAFGLSADDTKGAMRAVIQMLGKGKVNAEDLRQQLAERIPAAIPMLAKSMGITIGELEDQMKKGAIPAEKLVGMFRLMAQDVTDSGALAKSMKTLESGTQLLSNTLKKSGQSFFQSGLDKALGNVFGTLAKYLEKNQSLIKGIGGSLSAVLNMVVAVLEPLFSTIIQPIIFGLGKIYDLFDEISNMNGTQAWGLDPITGTLRNLTGLVYTIYYGWLLIQQTIDNFTWGGLFEDIALLMQQWDNFTNKILGNPYINDMGEKQQGWSSPINTALASGTQWLNEKTQGITNVINNNITVTGNGDSFLEETFNMLSGYVNTGNMSPTAE